VGCFLTLEINLNIEFKGVYSLILFRDKCLGVVNISRYRSIHFHYSPFDSAQGTRFVPYRL